MNTNYNKITKEGSKNKDKTKEKTKDPEIIEEIQIEETNNQKITNNDVVDIKKICKQYVNVSKLNVRKSPDIKSLVICILNNNDSVLILDTLNNNWLHVRLNSGLEGYVMKEFIKEI